MTTISRLNTTIGDHNMLTNFVAACFLTAGVIVGIAAVFQGNDLVQDNRTSQTATSTVQTAEQTGTLTLNVVNATPGSLQTQPKNVANQLQPAQNRLQSSTTAAATLQPAANTIQLTGGADLQDAANILQ